MPGILPRSNAILWLLLLISAPLLAQVDSTAIPTQGLEDEIEDLILNSGIDEQVDYSDFLEPIQQLMQRPLDLNSASYEDLLILPGMTAIQAQRLVYHRQRFGALTSIYELQAVEGYTVSFIREFLPFVTVEKAGAKDLDKDLRFPRGPSFQEVKKGLEFEWLQRMTFVVEEQRGYTAPDTTFRNLLDVEGNPAGVDTVLSSRYVGSPFRQYTRIRARMGNFVSVGLVGEQDPGEQFTWNPANRQLGYDYLSAHFSMQDFGRLKRLIIGDYTLQFGQGLVLSRGLGFGKGAAVIAGVKSPAYGARPYLSVNENQFFRGGVVTYGLSDWELTAFVSRAFRDASIRQVDSLDDEVIAAGNLQISGLHRTASELANRKSVGETVAGGRAAYAKGTFRGGVTHYQLRYDAPLNPSTAAYQTFAFRGDEHHLTGMDWDWVKGNVNLFGEVAMARGGAIGGTASMMSSLAPTVDFSLGIRHFDKDFFSPFAYVFAERPLNAQNESGIYMGLRYAPNYNWEFLTYFDQYQSAWSRFRTSFPSQGYEWMAQLQYKPSRSTSVYLRVRTEQTERDPGSEAGQQLGSPVMTQRDQFRIHFQTNIDRQISLKTRLEGSRFQEEGSQDAFGWLLYQDMSWKYGYRWTVTGRFAVFNIDNYDARIYAYENDILGFFSIPPYYRRGTRWYLILNGKLGHGWEFWARVAQTNLANGCTYEAAAPASPGMPAGTTFIESCSFGTGLEAIDSPRRTDIKLQLRWRF